MARPLVLPALAITSILGLAVSVLAIRGETPPSSAAGTGPAGTVILMHGLIRSARSMSSLEQGLSEHGFKVVNIDYPSTESSIAELSEMLDRALEECCSDTSETLHFVTHSLGGIIVRFYLDRHDLPGLGRVVMLSPPNNGSEIVDLLKDYELFQTGVGPAALELATEGDGVPARLGPVDYELGVITGNRSINPVFSWLIPGDDDGQVSVEGARVEGMADFLVVPHTHTFIMNSPDVIGQTLHFLEHGRFDLESP